MAIQEEKNELTNQKEKSIDIKEIKETIKDKKTLPKEENSKIYKRIMKNILIAIAVSVYFIFINLGFLNIENNIYITDLKVFSVCILLIAIVIIENAYKKDSGELAIYGIETIVLAITSVAMIYVNIMMYNKYVYIVSVVSYLFSIYYLIKSIVIYLKMRKQYFVNNMKEIIKDED